RGRGRGHDRVAGPRDPRQAIGTRGSRAHARAAVGPHPRGLDGPLPSRPSLGARDRRRASEHREVRAAQRRRRRALRRDGGAARQGGRLCRAREGGLVRGSDRRVLLERRRTSAQLPEASPRSPRGEPGGTRMSRDPFRFEEDRVILLDQTLLPDREETIEIRDAREMADAISRLAVRGAPAIGIAAALALAVEAARDGSPPLKLERLEDAGRLLVASRPTAVNLAWAVERVLGAARRALVQDSEHLAARVREEALAIWDEDRMASRAMAGHGAS